MDVVADGFGKGGDVLGEAGGAELGDVGAGVVLILRLQVLRHVDELDVRCFAEGGEDGGGELDPGVGFAGAEIEEAAGAGGLGEVEGHADGVLHIKEIAHLLAMLIIGAVGLEELHLAGGEDLAAGLVNEAAHVGLVVLVGAIDVEVFEADDARQPALAFRVKVEEVLRVAVHVQRAKFMDVRVLIIHAVGSIAIGSGGGGIDKPRLIGERPLAELLGELVVVPHEVVRIPLGGGGAGSEVEDVVKAAQFRGRMLHGLKEVMAVDVVGKAQRHEVLPFLIRAEAVANDDVFAATTIQLPNEGAADESGPAGDEDATIGVLHEPLPLAGFAA